MNLYERSPAAVELDGRVYRLKTGFQGVLRSASVLTDTRLHPDVRLWAALRAVVRGPLPRDKKQRERLLLAAHRLFFPPGRGGRRSLSLEQDADMIRAAFLQAYRIDLWRENISWFQFCELLSCIPSGTRLADVIDIRTRPMPKPTKHNAQERRRLLEAKAAVAIRLTPKEQEASRQRSADGLARALMTMARK